MMARNCVLITGSTGNVGSEVLRSLFSYPDPDQLSVRIAHHNPDKLLDLPYAGKADELVTMDFEKPETFDGAVRECDILFLMRPPRLTDIDRIFKPFLETAVKNGLNKVVFLSVQGAENNSFIPHHKIEKVINDLSMEFIFVRPSYFMQNLTTTLKSGIAKSGKIEIPSADARFNWIDVEDIGRTIAHLLFHFESFKNSEFTLTGPQNLSFSEVSDRIRAVLHIDLPHHSPAIISFFLKTALRTNLVYAFIQTYLHVSPRFSNEPEISEDIRMITGTPAGTLDSFLAKNAALIKKIS